MNKLTDQIQAEVNKVVLGKEDIVRKVLLAILAQGHVLLEDVPGVGKTTLAKAFSKTLGLDSKRVQFTSDTLPSDIIGFSVFDKADGKLKYQSGAIMTNLLLADEINRTSSKTQSALLEAMEELQVTVDGVTRPLPKPFIVLATENPVGSAGTQMLPASQLDRFMLQLSMGYPNRASTAALLKDRHHVDPLSACQTVTSPAELEKLIAEVSNIHVADRIYDYIAELVDLTRSNAYVTLGVSPRGALAVTRAAKANAYLEGRDYVIPDDVCAVFPDVCVHRLILNSKARLQDYTAALILQNVLTSANEKNDLRQRPVLSDPAAGVGGAASYKRLLLGAGRTLLAAPAAPGLLGGQCLCPQAPAGGHSDPGHSGKTHGSQLSGAYPQRSVSARNALWLSGLYPQ